MAGARSSEEGAGLAGHLRGFIASLLAYLKLRFQLIGLESKEAAAHYVKIVALLVAGGVVMVFGYIFFSVGLAFVLAWLLNVRLMWVLLAFGLLHFVVTAVCLVLARGRFALPMFRWTINEFKKDQSWLSTPETLRKHS